MLVCLLSFTFLYVFITCIAAFVRNKLMMMMMMITSQFAVNIRTVWSTCSSVQHSVDQYRNQLMKCQKSFLANAQVSLSMLYSAPVLQCC